MCQYCFEKLIASYIEAMYEYRSAGPRWASWKYWKESVVANTVALVSCFKDITEPSLAH